MSELSIPFGRGHLSASVPDHLHFDVIAPKAAPAAADPLAVVAAALARPIGQRQLSDFRQARSAAVAINDKTRPVPHQHLLPPLLQCLEDLGVAPSAITLIIATGTHPPMRPDEFSAVVPAEILARYPVISHDGDDEGQLVARGITPFGTPIQVNRRFCEADLRIAVGNIEPHQFAGFSGGVKTAAIGLAGRATISANHAMMSRPAARLGTYAGNPVRQDIDAIGAAIGVHFALNAILNSDKAIVHALFGDPSALMPAGVALARAICQVEVDDLYDLLVVAPGGHPKDINIYQAQKALGHASLIIREGGTIIWAAACPEGAGSDHYEQWVQQLRSFDEVLARFQQEGFRVGPHKAYQIARDGSRVRLLFVTAMDPERARRLLLDPIPSLDEALRLGLAGLPAGARLGVMPLANATIPTLKPKEIRA